VQRLGLVGPEPVDAARAQRLGDLRMQLLGQRHRPRGPAVLRRLHHQALVLPPGGQQLVPRLDVTDDGHRSV
jgi:hypothetical protein